jgi:LuxR family maltose regulon positive regulatory protein
MASVLCWSLQGLLLTSLALGRRPAAAESIRTLLPVTQSALSSDNELARSFEARLALVQGDLDTACRWLLDPPPALRYQMLVALEEPTLTRALALLAVGDADQLAEAASILAAALAFYDARHDMPRIVEIRAMQALVLAAQGSRAEALDGLEQAVQLAAPGGLVRPFVALGPPMSRLLVDLERRPDAPQYVARLLSAFASRGPLDIPPAPARESVPTEMIVPLSDRELEVLAHLADRLSNKEIASTLCISWQTVAKHTGNVFQKLQVTNRRDAVRCGRALGLIPPGAPDNPFADAPPSDPWQPDEP